MQRRRRPSAIGRIAAAVLGVAALSSAGCWLPNGFLDPTKVGRFPVGVEYHEVGIRRVLTSRDTPSGPANATEPTADDLSPVAEDYVIGPGDTLTVVVDDLLREGLQEVTQAQVTPTGFVNIVKLGSVKVDGLTERQAEQEIKSQLRQAEILADPQVRVFVAVARQRVFNILGAVTAAGQYAITDPALRLLDAISIARGIDPNAKRFYVIRQVDGPARPGRETGEATEPGPKSDGLVIPPPTEPEDDYVSFSTAAGTGQDAPSSRPRERDRELEELNQILAPRQTGAHPRNAAGRAAPARRDPVRRSSDQQFAPLIYDPETGEPTQVEPEGERDLPGGDTRDLPRGDVDDPTDPSGRREFSWESVPDEGLSQRIIAIDHAALRNGDPRYNIVVRNRDVIHIPVDVGVFYMMGEINRPGVYALGGRDITIKQAIALAGGFSALAWPERCEIIRRESGTDKELTISVNLDAIFGGLQDDVLLRDEDIVNVGSHIVAPFLFVVRNSFRFTYGFGFVYDRNFADKDAYGAQSNPVDVRRFERQNRGLPF